MIPAIDILGGRCVRLLRGDYAHPTVYSDNPVEMAARFADAGAKRIHVVDLDGARGAGDNRALIQAIAGRDDVEVQAAGGIRTEERIEGLLDAGAHVVVVGTAAVREPELLERVARKHSGRVMTALDGSYKPTGWLSVDGNFSFDRSDVAESLYSPAGLQRIQIPRERPQKDPQADMRQQHPAAAGV